MMYRLELYGIKGPGVVLKSRAKYDIPPYLPPSLPTYPPFNFSTSLPSISTSPPINLPPPFPSFNLPLSLLSLSSSLTPLLSLVMTLAHFPTPFISFSSSITSIYLFFSVSTLSTPFSLIVSSSLFSCII